MEQLEKRLGYTFSDRSYLETALNHSSYANEQPQTRQSNERLEFLGDAVLGFCAAKTLFRLFPDMPEGGLTRLRAELVCEASLHQVALAFLKALAPPPPEDVTQALQTSADRLRQRQEEAKAHQRNKRRKKKEH